MTKSNDNTDNNTDDSRGGSEEPSERKGNLLETIFTFLSAATILFVIIYLIMMVVQPESPAAFKLTHSTPEKRGEQWHVEILARNSGDQAVRDVEIEGMLDAAVATATIDWLPGKSTREAILVFDEQPTATLELAVKGYLMP